MERTAEPVYLWRSCLRELAPATLDRHAETHPAHHRRDNAPRRIDGRDLSPAPRHRRTVRLRRAAISSALHLSRRRRTAFAATTGVDRDRHRSRRGDRSGIAPISRTTVRTRRRSARRDGRSAQSSVTASASDPPSTCSLRAKGSRRRFPSSAPCRPCQWSLRCHPRTSRSWRLQPRPSRRSEPNPRVSCVIEDGVIYGVGKVGKGCDLPCGPKSIVRRTSNQATVSARSDGGGRGVFARLSLLRHAVEEMDGRAQSQDERHEQRDDPGHCAVASTA